MPVESQNVHSRTLPQCNLMHLSGGSLLKLAVSNSTNRRGLPLSTITNFPHHFRKKFFSPIFRFPLPRHYILTLHQQSQIILTPNCTSKSSHFGKKDPIFILSYLNSLLSHLLQPHTQPILPSYLILTSSFTSQYGIIMHS